MSSSLAFLLKVLTGTDFKCFLPTHLTLFLSVTCLAVAISVQKLATSVPVSPLRVFFVNIKLAPYNGKMTILCINLLKVCSIMEFCFVSTSILGPCRAGVLYTSIPYKTSCCLVLNEQGIIQ